MTFPSDDWEKVQWCLARRIGLDPQEIVIAAFKLGWWELCARWARLDGENPEVWIARARREYEATHPERSE